MFKLIVVSCLLVNVELPSCDLSDLLVYETSDLCWTQVPRAVEIFEARAAKSVREDAVSGDTYVWAWCVGVDEDA